ncbi:hypothetical protein Glove_26g300 [Diversispora epigaea]|uniref:rRNA methyltransferase 2, mitochondrial n=1 Tax=Diversispora epigaea TaxID=1348612 RepID=A0A397JK59_9GLOM|nr:hypothetical protein Glove_26g300 [Diversispora epigaea]
MKKLNINNIYPSSSNVLTLLLFNYIKSYNCYCNNLHRHYASSASSKRWIARQQRDQFSKKASMQNFRARSAYKLVELDEKFNIIKPNSINIDCGASPGSWSQYISRKLFPEISNDNNNEIDDNNDNNNEVDDNNESEEEDNLKNSKKLKKVKKLKKLKKLNNLNNLNSQDNTTTRDNNNNNDNARDKDNNNTTTRDNNSIIIAVDLLYIDPIPGVNIIQGDFTNSITQEKIKNILRENQVDAVLSDMAPNFTGTHFVDHVRSMELCESSFVFAEQVLKPGGTFLCKFLMGGQEMEFRKLLQTKFEKVRYEKPEASHSKSTEGYYLCLGYKENKINKNNNSALELCESSFVFAEQVLKPGGTFLCKFLMGGQEMEFRKLLQTKFEKVRYEKPEASHSKSTEGYYLCLGYKENKINKNNNSALV